jgi:hypothetical protein
MVLSFELKEDELEIYLDEAGVDTLIKKLELLKKQKLPAHDHLQTPAWGGNELTERLHADRNILLNQVTIIKIK